MGLALFAVARIEVLTHLWQGQSLVPEQIHFHMPAVKPTHGDLPYILSGCVHGLMVAARSCVTANHLDMSNSSSTCRFYCFSFIVLSSCWGLYGETLTKE
jgi:hypothetical protein